VLVSYKLKHRNASKQGCQIVYFQTKNPNLGQFCRALHWKMLTYFMAIGNILPTFVILYDHLVQFMFIWYIFPILISCSKKNLATLLLGRMILHRGGTWTHDLLIQFGLRWSLRSFTRVFPQVTEEAVFIRICVSHVNTQIVHDIIAMISLKNLTYMYPGGILTRVFCSWSGCEVHCATPPESGSLVVVQSKKLGHSSYDYTIEQPND
jgi:hypothetical protein